jgi:hypothetical protein
MLAKLLEIDLSLGKFGVWPSDRKSRFKLPLINLSYFHKSELLIYSIITDDLS